jgi:hypothetical protein
MKKVLFFATLIMSVFVVSCSKLPKDIKLTDELVAFAELNEANDTLWGVKNSKGEVLIAPNFYRNFTVDDNIITCEDAEGYTEAFKHSGEKIGQFELFTHWNQNGDYYQGVKYRDCTYYFVKTNEIVNASDEFTGLTFLFLNVDGQCEIRNYDGVLLWKIPQDATIIKEEKAEEYFILLPEGNMYALYDTNGQVTKKINQRQYKKLLNKSSPQHAYGTYTFISAPNVLK